eukprot:gene30679-39957_t
MTGKAFKKILESEKIWDFFIQYRISAFNTNFYNNSHLSINFLKDVLGYRRAKDFYLSFRRLEFNIIGWFRALPPFNTDGGLFRGTYVENELLYQLVDANGELVHEKSFKIRYDNVSGNLTSQSLSGGGASYIVELGNKIIFHSTSTLPSSSISFEPIPAKEVSTKVMQNAVNREPEFLILESILGFHISRYNQGCVLEILNISISNQSISTWIQPITVPAIDFGQLQLHGLKITGDDYVPSGEVSFCINLDREVDPEARLLWRHRRIVYYPNVPYGRENFSVEERLDNIAAWYPGYMQVAFPGFQHPSWAACQFIMYRNPLANGGRFNIIWDNRLDATEFRPLFQGNETEPRVTTTLEPPAATATATAMESPSLLPWQPQQEDATSSLFSSSWMAAVLPPDNSFMDFLEDNEEQEADANDHVVLSERDSNGRRDV